MSGVWCRPRRRRRPLPPLSPLESGSSGGVRCCFQSRHLGVRHHRHLLNLLLSLLRALHHQLDRHPVEAENLVDDAVDLESLEDLDHQVDCLLLDNLGLGLLLNRLVLEAGVDVQDLVL